MNPSTRRLILFLIALLDRSIPFPIIRSHAVRGELREAICNWLLNRFKLPSTALSPDEHILPVCGTREGLFAIAQCIVDRHKERPLVIIPNPFYQIYEGAALLAGAQPWYLNCVVENNFLPAFDLVPPEVWERCQLVYLCSPGNPTGAVQTEQSLAELLRLADEHDFIVAADECYSEIYLQENRAPLGLLEAAARNSRPNFRRCLVFHSLSKRSNLPGMRSGFVAGDAELIEKFLRYRTYHGCSMALYTQAASRVAWSDETHVRSNRALYREKFDAVLEILSTIIEIRRPDAGFYLWPQLPGDDVAFARGLLADQNVIVLPGSFLAREAAGLNPGYCHARIALVASLEECIEAAIRIRNYMNTL